MRFLVAGCGSIGKRHIRNLLRLGSADIVACDPRQDRRDEIKQNCGITACEDFALALKEGFDAVLVCTPSILHLEYARMAVNGGAHVFIEKPLATSIEGMAEFVAAAEDQGRIVLVGCNYRFHWGLALTKRVVREGQIGRPLFARAQFGQFLPDWHPWEDYRKGYSARRDLGGGVVLDRIHEIDYLVDLLGEVRDVSCSAERLSDLDIDTEDYAHLLLRFKEGTVGEVHVDYLQRAYNCECKVAGSEGTVIWSYTDNAVKVYDATEQEWHITQRPTPYDANEMYINEMKHFLACLRGEDQSQLDGRRAMGVLRIALAAKESAKLGRRIRLDEVSV